MTGTNGKTSVVEYTRQICDAAGLRAAGFGTLGRSKGTTREGGVGISNALGGPVETLRRAKADRYEVVVFEAVSRALANRYYDAIPVDSASHAG